MRYNKGKYNHVTKRDYLTNVENKARYLAAEGRFDESVSLLKDEIDKDYTNEHLRYELAKIYFKREYYQDAIDELKMIEEPTSINPFFIYQTLGNCYSFLSMYEEAYYYLLKAYYADPKKDEKNVRFLVIAGRKAGLKDELLAFLDSKPVVHDHDTIFQIIYFYNIVHRNEDALKWILKHKFNPSIIFEYGVVADVYVSLYDWKTALGYVDRYDFFDPKDAPFFTTKAVVKYFAHDYDASYELFKKVNESDCTPSLLTKSTSWLARIELLRENIESAKSYYNRLEDSPIKNILKAEIEVAQGNYDVAINLLETVILPVSKSLDVMILYVNILIRVKEYQKAKIFIEDILLTSPNIPERTMYEIKRYIAIANKNLGETVEKSNSYFVKQVSDYSNGRSLDHIMAHYSSENGSAKFSSSFNLNEEYFKIYYLIRDMVPFHRAIDTSVDIYVIDYPGAGVLGDISLDKIQVVTVMGTKDIITLYPVSQYTLEYEYEEDFVPKKETQKRLTQIEKFNQRYGNKNNN